MPFDWGIPIDPEKKTLFEKAQSYADRNLFDEALLILEPIDCVLGCWQKGKICLQAADSIRNSWIFKNYATAELKNRYEQFIQAAYNHFDRTSILLISADVATQRFLNQYLWGQIFAVENHWVQLKPTPILEEEDYTFMEDVVPKTDDLIDDFCDWKL